MPNIYIKFNRVLALLFQNLTPPFYREVLKMLSFFGYFIKLKKESILIILQQFMEEDPLIFT